MNHQDNRSRPFNQGHGGRPQSHGGHQGGGNSPTLERITSPYNFVPLSQKVFFPDWAGHVSQDIPFADGVSGELTCELVTDTPIYIRNGGKWEHDDVMKNAEAQSFFYVKQGDKRLFMIPGTTLKGILRSVIEIASFGKMNKVDDHRYGVRDLQNPNLYGKYMTIDTGSKTYKPLSAAGWLVLDQDTEEWRIIPCDYARVDHKDLANPALHVRQSALKKYATWGENRLKVTFDCTQEMPHPHSGGKKLIYRRVTRLTGGNTPGTLVFTGQPAPNDGRPGKKHMEFVFFNEQPVKTIAVPKTIRREFQFIHSDANDVPNEEWGYWKKKLNSGQRVPVFYLTGKDGSLQSVGLAMMFRLPYANSVRQAIEHSTPDHFHDDPDLAETIFGFVNGSTAALKGRVAVSSAIATHAEPASCIQTVLGGPKPSFYPNYIEQPNPAGQYKTFMDSDCRIRGWKRYPARQSQDVHVNKGVTDKVDTKLIPLKEKARFTFRVKMHNLKPVEVGAVVWALTWGDNNGLRHSLGMGKSMGFGLASIAISSADVDWKSAMLAFEQMMDKEVGGGWRKTVQMEQLLAMANPSTRPQCGALKHLFLAPGAGNEFVNAKKAKLALRPHAPVSGRPDAERFRDLKVRPKNGMAKQIDEQRQPAAANAAMVSADEIWEKATLTFDKGRGELKAAFDGKTATCKRSADIEEAINKVTRKGFLVTQVTARPLGGKNYTLVGIQLP